LISGLVVLAASRLPALGDFSYHSFSLRVDYPSKKTAKMPFVK
jgi:hypothetical protein